MRERLKRLAPKSMIRIYQRARYLGITALFFAARLLPVRKNLVALCNVWGYGDNAKYVAEELIARKRAAREAGNAKSSRMPDMSAQERRLWRSLQIVFITNRPEQVPACPELTARRTNTPRAVLALARARVWVDNNRKEAYIRKRRGQYYIQLWHGGVALKKIEGDCVQALGKEYIRRARRDSAATDLFISNSDFCTRMYRRAFWAKCEIAEYGSPRNDRFVHIAAERAEAGGINSGRAGQMAACAEAGEKNSGRAGQMAACAEAGSINSGRAGRTAEQAEAGELSCSRGVAAEGKLLPRRAVYAPTYRTGRNSFCSFDAAQLRAALADRFGGEWEILVRLHPLAAEGRGLRKIPGVRDISGAPDLYEILYGADVLITDYSNTMFEFAMTGRPVFLYADDVREYERERGLYFDFRTLPFDGAETAKELYRQIRDYDPERRCGELRRLYEAVGLKESGRAAALVAERIAAECGEE